MLSLHHRQLMQDYVDLLSSEKQAIQHLSSYYSTVRDSSRSLRAKKTKKRVFDILSKNALQNVMVFLDYKGADFLKMRCICKKTNNAYMQELKKRFNAQKYFDSLNQEYYQKAKAEVSEFIENSLPLEFKLPDQCKEDEFGKKSS